MVNGGKNAKVTQKLRKCYAISEGLFAFSSGCYVLKNANLHLMVLFFETIYRGSLKFIVLPRC